MNFHAGALVVIHKYVRTPKARYSCRDWECAYNEGQALPDSQAEPDLHELHKRPNSGRHLFITMRAGAWELGGSWGYFLRTALMKVQRRTQ